MSACWPDRAMGSNTGAYGSRARSRVRALLQRERRPPSLCDLRGAVCALSARLCATDRTYIPCGRWRTRIAGRPEVGARRRRIAQKRREGGEHCCTRLVAVLAVLGRHTLPGTRVCHVSRRAPHRPCAAPLGTSRTLAVARRLFGAAKSLVRPARAVSGAARRARRSRSLVIGTGACGVSGARWRGTIAARAGGTRREHAHKQGQDLWLALPTDVTRPCQRALR